MIIALGAGLVSTTNDLKDGESGTRSDEAKTTTATAALDKVQLDTVTTHDGEGVTTTLKTKMTINPCPDAKGQFEAKATIDVSATKSGGSTGQKGTLDVTINGQVDDDAKLASSEADYRMQWADFSGGKGSFVEVAGAFGDTKITGATLTRSGGAANVKLLESAAVTASLYTVMAKYWIVQEAEKGWQSGRCVVLTPTAAPGPKGMKPGSNSSIAAAPRSRIDSTPVGGSVTATLSAGGASVDPAGSKVPADATFTYTAPGEVDQSGTVSLEARSKRGVAKADITFDTSGSYSYSITGGLQDFQVVGQVVCDVRGPFALESPGVATATFSGGESLSGTYTATGVFGLSYAGTYSISLPDGPGKPGTMSGSSSGETAGQAGSGTETYILTPVEPCT